MPEHSIPPGQDALKDYTARRAELLASITVGLAADARFIAAWLAGSFGRGEADDVSDLDLTVVVADRAAETLCVRPWAYAGRTTNDRLALFRRFGAPAALYEIHANAPAGGTFTFVLYAGPAVVVDWTLVPQAVAARPIDSQLLFEHARITVQPPPEPLPPGERLPAAAERLAFFWLMTTVTAKYVVRRDTVSVLKLYEMASAALLSAEELAAGGVPAFHHGSSTPLATSVEAQSAAVREEMARATALTAALVEQGVTLLPPPTRTIEVILGLAGDAGNGGEAA